MPLPTTFQYVQLRKKRLFQRSLFQLTLNYNHQFITNSFSGLNVALNYSRPKIPRSNVTLQFSTGGNLVLPAGYLWDGASGPVPNWKESLRGTAVHDALYNLMGGHPNHFDPDRQNCRRMADDELERILGADGLATSKIRRWMLAVRWFGTIRRRALNLRLWSKKTYY